jgi:hypothetical protein
LNSPLLEVAPASFGARVTEFVAIALICAMSAIAITKNIGDVTVYASENEDNRHRMHDAILDNTPPDGKTWNEAGANNLNVRVAIVQIAKLLSDNTNLSIDTVYRLIDLVSLFAALVLIYYLLKTWFPPSSSLIGLLIVCALLPLTMLGYHFHPWDRPMLFLWSAMIWALSQNRLIAFALLYAMAIIVKLDAVMAVGMIWFARVRVDDWKRPTLETAAVGIVGALTLGSLVTLFPGGQETFDIARQVTHNVAVARGFGVAYPPLLTHGLMFALGLLAWTTGGDMAKRLWLFGLAMLLPHILVTNFVEVRAQVGTILCMLPLALSGLLAACNSVTAPFARPA